jgi:hypothetical protein
MTIFELTASVVVFCGLVLGLGWPLAGRLRMSPADRALAAAALGVLGIFLAGWVVYVASLPLACLWLLPALAAVGLAVSVRSLRIAGQDRDLQHLAIGQLLVTLWCVGGLALVRSYSGGMWVADWFGHLQRTLFFLLRWPRDILFNGFDALPSRPPLANVVYGVMMQLTELRFAHYQLFSTLLASLAFLPAARLARRWGNQQAPVVLVVLFMLNPLFWQNATYAWTKLAAAFFTLGALHFFLVAHDEAGRRTPSVLWAVCLAAGLLTHYSAAPYLLVMVAGWLWLGRRRFAERGWRHATLGAAACGAAVLAAWFGWALWVYGPRGALLTNSSITDQAPTLAAQLNVVMLNIRDTLVPHFLRSADFSLLDQRSSAGWWRDWFFQLYQVNLFFAFGSVAWVAILFRLRQLQLTCSGRRLFWWVFITANILLGIAVHGGRDAWGLAHICLQPIILLGLVLLAAHWPTLARPWRLALIVGGTLDFCLGIVLQAGAQAFAFDRWFGPARSLWDAAGSYSVSAQKNFLAKEMNGWTFVGDFFAPHATLIAALLLVCMLAALVRVGRSHADTPPVHR